jgi:hypothetical protein
MKIIFATDVLLLLKMLHYCYRECCTSKLNLRSDYYFLEALKRKIDRIK